MEEEKRPNKYMMEDLLIQSLEEIVDHLDKTVREFDKVLEKLKALEVEKRAVSKYYEPL